MVNDPYSVLEISPNASDDEVKRAYREQSRKYHPDSYIDNPLADLAEEKFKEVQEAYDQIMAQRSGGQSFGNGYANTAKNNSYGTQQEAVEMQAVYNYLNSRHYREALNLLSRMNNRDARWYYCSALANANLGNNFEANNHAQQAVNMEPNNREYRDLLNQLQWSGQRYQTSSYNQGRPRYSTGNFCCDLWCADSCCECMGGDLCSCM